MRHLFVIGIGPGDPDHVTVQAVEAMNKTQVFFIPDKGTEKAELRRLRLMVCERFIRDKSYRIVEFAAQRRRTDLSGYRETVAEWHGRIAEQYAGLFQAELRDGETGGFLVWGDPSLYDSTIRILDAVQARGDVAFDTTVIPGITSVQALAARHRIALNGIGEPVHITTGRRLAAGVPDDLDAVVVMLDGEQAFLRVPREDFEIVWGAYLGTPDEMLAAGPLAEVADDIARRRAEARQAKGWIMDTYLLRRRPRGTA